MATDFDPGRNISGLTGGGIVVVFRDVRNAVLAEQKRLVTESGVRLGAVRDSYTSSSYASWVGNWSDLVDRLAGSGVQHVYRRSSSLSLSRDFLNYPFDSPACRRFDKSEDDSFLACALYNSESRRLQLALTWHEPEWAVVREGDADPARGDRIALRVPGVVEGELFAAPQIATSRREIENTCANDWAGEPVNARCGQVPVAIYKLAPNGLLGAAINGSNGIAFRSTVCPTHVLPPCVRMLISILAHPPSADAYVCIAQHDAAARTDHSVTMLETCDAGSLKPHPGGFLDPGLKMKMSHPGQACDDGKMCLCEDPKGNSSSCIEIDAEMPRDTSRVEGANLPKTIGQRIARWLADSVDHFDPIPPSHANAAFLSSISEEPVGYLVGHVPTASALESATSDLSKRLPLYGVVLFIPIVLFFAMARELGRAANRMRSAEQEAARIRDEAMRQKAEAARDEALAQVALAEAALRSANSGLEDLGHEIISPAQSLLLVVDELKHAAVGSVFQDLLGNSNIDPHRRVCSPHH